MKKIFNKIKEFAKKKDVSISLKRYGIDAMSAMAQGLFASLLIGTILSTLGTQLNIELLKTIGDYAMKSAGVAMAISIGYALKAPPLVLFSLSTVGASANSLGGAGGPLAVLVIGILSAEVGKLVSKETKVDIIVTPAVTIIFGVTLSMLLAPSIGFVASSLGNAIMWATDLQPFLMGIIVALIVGMALTLPISSAAICAALNLTGLAGGAAVAGCCAQMVGFAVASFKENKVGGLISQGIGTSMLQMSNIIKNWKVWIPACVASVVTGQIATCFFKLKMNGPAISSGMGTCGLVGPIGVYSGWLNDVSNGLKDAVTVSDWVSLTLICLIIPAVVACFTNKILRKINWIKENDMKLDV